VLRVAIVCSTLSMLSLLLTPFIFLSNLLLFSWREIIFDVEGPSNLLRGLSFDHIGHSLAADIQQALDIQVVRSLHAKNDKILLRLLSKNFEKL